MNILEIAHLQKNYRDFSLNDINLTLPCGCILGLIGENGAGKSTTIKLILNMIRRDGGDIRLFGTDTRRNSAFLKEDIGVVLDEAGIPECITAEQLNAILKHTYKKWDEHTYFSYLNELELPRQKPFKDFSRGMKMKLSIAAALSHRPKLLLLDEPTSGLDPVARDKVTDLFHDFTRDESHSILISSHIVSDLEKLSDYIAFLHKGKLLMCEEKDRLLERYGMLHCTRQQLNEIAPDAILGMKSSPYGIDAVADREKLPEGFKISPVSIEDLFIYLVKETK